MIKSYLIIIFFVCKLACSAQDPSQDLPNGFFVPFIAPDLTDIKGDPYLQEKWETGSITTETGIFHDLLLRYEIASDILEYKRGTFTLSFKSGALKSFVISGGKTPRRFRYFPQEIAKKKSREGFYEVVPLGPDSTELLVRHRKNLYEADFGPYSVQERSEYRYEPTVFILGNGRLDRVRLTTKFCKTYLAMSKEDVDRSLRNVGILLDE